MHYTRIRRTMQMLLPLLLLLSTAELSEGASPANRFCGLEKKTYLPNSVFEFNLRQLSNVLITNATMLHSFSATVGTSPDQVYGTVLCRVDYSFSDCAEGLREAFRSTMNSTDPAFCPRHMDVTLYYEKYQLRFSDSDFLSGFTNQPEWAPATLPDIKMDIMEDTADGQFDDLVRELLGKVAEAAANNRDKYATGGAWFPEKSKTVFGLVQCTHDMPQDRCRSCLDSIIDERRQKINRGQMGGAILGTRCIMLYNIDTPFTSNTQLWLYMPSDNTFWIWIVIGSFSVIVSTSFLLVHIWIKTQRKREQARFELRRLSMAIQNVIHLWRIEEGNSGFSLYDFSQIKEATDNFSSENKLGQGGFGPVYKGQLPGGLEVAVKRLAACSVQGLLEFKNEIQLIAKLQHKNLVRLMGCCILGDQEKMLVYEYMQNKSLDFFLFDCVKGKQLSWSNRLHIIDGIAQGLLYLHKHSRLCVVHRDLKASNILLDSEMNPKISDFGMARIFCSNITESNTTRIVGTHGYISPEYAFDGICSIKSDVFSFGVLILEIISGKRTAGFYQYDAKLYNLISYAWQLWRDGQWLELLFCPIGNFEHQVIEKCIQVALLCVQESAEDRPNMDHVVTMLNSENVSLPNPKQPAYFYVRPSGSDVSSCNFTLSITLAR